MISFINMASLQKLIINLRQSKDLNYIHNPSGLIHALEELDSLIGLENIKDDIAEQTSTLLHHLREGKRSNQMLNTVLYGPPGVGKTTVGIKLALIWNNLGYLKTDFNETWTEQVTSMMEDEMNQQWLILGLYVLFMLGSLVWGAASWIKSKTKSTLSTVILIVAAVAIIGCMYYIATKYFEYQEMLKLGDPVREGDDPHVHNHVQEAPIKILSATDFISGYLGQTALKTRNLLRKYRGKVIFIDEAYKFITGHASEYGMEALTELTQHMSEHPQDNVFIFSGYRDLMEKGIFNAQKGLVRRFMWYFDVGPYDGPELYQIFKQQLLADEGLEIQDEEQTEALICQNMHEFPYYAGDTHKLVNFVTISYSSRFDNHQKLITMHDMHSGIERLKRNNTIKQKDRPNLDGITLQESLQRLLRQDV